MRFFGLKVALGDSTTHAECNALTQHHHHDSRGTVRHLQNPRRVSLRLPMFEFFRFSGAVHVDLRECIRVEWPCSRRRLDLPVGQRKTDRETDSGA